MKFKTLNDWGGGWGGAAIYERGEQPFPRINSERVFKFVS